MQAPSRAHGHSVRNYAPAWPSGPCAKPSSGKSFTIEALLAKPEDKVSSSPTQGGFKAAACVLPLASLPIAPVACVCSAGVLHCVQQQPGCPVYCSYQAACTAASSTGLHAPNTGLHAPSTGLHAPSTGLHALSTGLHALSTTGGKSKRMRTSFSSEQLSRLEKEFARQQYMVGSERFLLASALQLTEAQVKVWFQNRRIKWRKQSLEQQQAKLAKLGLAAPPTSPGSEGHGEDQVSSDSDVDVDSSNQS